MSTTPTTEAVRLQSLPSGPPGPLSIVNAFLDAVEARDFEAAGRWLSAHSFSYVGPTRVFDRVEGYLAHLVNLGLIMKRIERRKAFQDGPDVCVIMDFMSTMQELDGIRIAQWFTVSRGKITRIEVFLDASPYHRLFDA